MSQKNALFYKNVQAEVETKIKNRYLVWSTMSFSGKCVNIFPNMDFSFLDTLTLLKKYVGNFFKYPKAAIKGVM